ncbi:MAG TPA: lipase maturation factor family protein [Opitutaceae bacterium]|nr:lipase maturation factor family protein [Opitutaceae bacterium]
MIVPRSPGRNAFAFSAVVFLRLLAFVHVIAFASAWVQIGGLIGPHGVAPAGAYLAAAHRQLGDSAYLDLPTLCWIFGTGAFLTVLCAAGVFVALLLFAGIAPVPCLLLLWAGYLSLVNAGQMFFAFQWDGLLLETTLLAIFVAPWRLVPRWHLHEPPELARLLVWWLLFRLMFLAGVVKLASGDPTWRNLTALTYHFETQPLPTPLAWYAQQLPAWWQRTECAIMFAIELGAPFLIFLPRMFRHAGALILAGFMGVIALTGNYTFFNALAVVLCLFCLDDAWWQRLLRLESSAVANASRTSARSDVSSRTAAADPATFAPADSSAPSERTLDGVTPPISGVTHPFRHPRMWRGFRGEPKERWCRWLLHGFALFAFGYTGAEVLMVLLPSLGAPPGFAPVATFVEPLRSFNSYGLFAVMTHPRMELIIEGSNDGREWREYGFPAKPGDVSIRPRFVAPYQPRLDWQLWFAALETPDQNPWVLSLCEDLLRGRPAVLSLLAKNPFPRHPPKYVRVIRYEYHFTDWDIRARTGHWWRRTPVDVYVAPVSLR